MSSERPGAQRGEPRAVRLVGAAGTMSVVATAGVGWLAAGFSAGGLDFQRQAGGNRRASGLCREGIWQRDDLRVQSASEMTRHLETVRTTRGRVGAWGAARR